MRRYKETLVGKGSQLESALEKSDAEASKVYKETSARYAAMHSAEDRAWFALKSQENAHELATNG